MDKKIVTVDEQDTVVGSVETIAEAIEKGFYRRIVRVFLKDNEGNILIQKRSKNVRYPLLLDQSAGGHVDEGEEYTQAALRETEEELGLTGVNLTEIVVSFKEGNVFSGIYKGNIPKETKIVFDTYEVESVIWMSQIDLNEKAVTNPEEFTIGFVKIWRELRDKIITS